MHPLEQFVNPSPDHILYVGGPYTHPDPAIRLQRFEQLTQAAANLIAHRYIVYSPITMTHPIDRVLAKEGETLGSDYWVAFDESFMRHCAAMVVIEIPGWEQSRGVVREIAFFEAGGKPVYRLSLQHAGLP